MTSYRLISYSCQRSPTVSNDRRWSPTVSCSLQRFTTVSSHYPFYRKSVKVRMSSSFADSSAWIKKMKARFAALDVDNNGVINEDDIALFAKKLAGYRKEGKDAEKRYFDTVNSVWSFGIGGSGGQGVNEDKFVQGMKQFVTRPDARERVNAYSAIVFGIIDADKDGVIDYDEFKQFHKACSNMDDQLIQRLFKDADINGDGVIRVSEFKASTAKFMLSAD